MLDTVKVIVGGVALLALCLLIGHWVGGPTPAVGLVKAVKVFVPLWLLAAGINMWVGVAKAGYSVAEEAPIFLVVFAVPTAVALFVCGGSRVASDDLLDVALRRCQCPRSGASSTTYRSVVALRLQHRFWSLRLVAGAKATPVARVGIFAPRIEPLSGAGDSVRSHYEVFRNSRNRAGAFTLVGVATLFASGVVYGANRYQNDGVALGLAVVALPFVIAGAVNDVKARDHLAQAMWLYNRSLPRAP